MKTEHITLQPASLRHDEWGFPTIDWTGDQGTEGQFRLSQERAVGLDSIPVETAAQAEIDALNAGDYDGGTTERHHYVLA